MSAPSIKGLLFGGGMLSDDDLNAINRNAQMQQALALLAASGPSAMPTNFGQVLLAGNAARDESVNKGMESALAQQKIMAEREQRKKMQSISGMFAQGEPTPERAKQILLAAIETGDPALVEYARKLKEMLLPQAKYEKLEEGQQLINPETKEVIFSGPQKSSKFSGAYGNLAIAMFGTDRASDLKPEQLQALDAEARRRQLERPPSVNVSIGGTENAFAKKGAEIMATSYNEIAANGRVAQRNLAQIDNLSGLLEKTGGGLNTQAKYIAGNLGIPVSGLSDVQAAQAVISQLVPQQRAPGSGQMSDADLALFKQSVPRLINQPGGNTLIIRTMRGIADYDRQIGKIASDALIGKISREQAEDMMQNVKNPLDGFSEKIGRDKAAAGGWSIKPAGK